MRASPSKRAAGFTVIELIMVLVILGVLSAIALPRMDGAMALRDGAWRDDVLSALRSAHASAMASQRQVCVSISTGSVAMTGPACSGTTSVFAKNQSVPATDAVSLIFRSDGTVTRGDGSAIADAFSINIAGLAPVTVYAGSGDVE